LIYAQAMGSPGDANGGITGGGRVLHVMPMAASPGRVSGTERASMAAGLLDPLFWGSLVLALAIAGVVAFPVNRWLIARGRGHALVHGGHTGDHGSL
jgi:hypothetical protein